MNSFLSQLSFSVLDHALYMLGHVGTLFEFVALAHLAVHRDQGKADDANPIILLKHVLVRVELQ